MKSAIGPDGQSYYDPREVARGLGWDTRRVKRNHEHTADENVVREVLSQLPQRSGPRPRFVVRTDSVDIESITSEAGPAGDSERRYHQLERARVHSLEHRGALLDQLEEAYLQLLSHVRSEKLLLDEIRLFEMEPELLLADDRGSPDSP